MSKCCYSSEYICMLCLLLSQWEPLHCDFNNVSTSIVLGWIDFLLEDEIHIVYLTDRLFSLMFSQIVNWRKNLIFPVAILFRCGHFECWDKLMIFMVLEWTVVIHCDKVNKFSVWKLLCSLLMFQIFSFGTFGIFSCNAFFWPFFIINGPEIHWFSKWHW